MAVSKYLPRDEFHLTICSLREDGYSEVEPFLSDLGIRVFVARFRPRAHSLRHLIASLRDQRAIAAWGPFDIQHSLDFTPSFLEALFAQTQGRRFVFSQRNMNLRGSRWSLRLKIALASRIVANSETVRRFLLREGAPDHKVTTVYLGIDPPGRPVDSREMRVNRNSLLSVGQIVRRKRHEDAIRTLALLQPETPELHLRIAGAVFDSQYQKELTALVAALGLSDRVEFLGARCDVLDLMEQADCLILCSELEAFANAIVEAMSVGLPVVAPRGDGSEEAVEDGKTGFLVPLGDVPSYARAVREIVGDPELRRKMGENATRIVLEKYSARRLAEEIAATYRKAFA